MVMLVASGLLGAALVRAPSPHGRSWPSSPDGGPMTVQDPPARWDRPARESLALLRRVTVSETRRSITDLAACEARVARTRRARDFRRCATAPLARMDGFATANSRMLQNLAGTAGPTEECRARVMTLSGVTGSLGFSARSTLRWWGATGDELLAASRAIRATAREISKLARARGWASTCPVLPPM